MDFNTIILRFRDMITNDDETITKHQKIIETHGYVWWAWWQKGNEKTPVDAFSSFAHAVKVAPQFVYLVDSGLSKIYKATCAELEFNEVEKTDSPDKDKSPEYYREQQYHAWFKFTNIEPCEKSELKTYSYHDCSELFGDDQPNYSRFHGKRIFSIAELLQQNRTLWLAREARDEDPDGEIILLNADSVMPENFTKRYFETKDARILWLSDLHLTDNVFENKPGGIRTTMAKQIHNLLNEYEQEDIGALLISGDITSCAKEKGYDQAIQLLKGINDELNTKLVASTIAVCPGNHDFVREDKTLEKQDPPAFIYENQENSKPYSAFYRKLYNISPNKFFACGKKLLLPTGHLVEIAALNSLMLQQYRNFEGHGFLSQEQLDFVAQEMGWTESRNQKAIRMVMMHHHYLPVCYTEGIQATKASSAVYDANRLMEWLVKYDVKILLHGHKHRSFFSQVSYPKDSGGNIHTVQNMHQISVVGMGGTGAGGVDHLFATIQFDGNDAEFNFYQMSHDEANKGRRIQTIRISL